MTVDSLAAYGANTNEGMNRCMNNEAFYLRMVKMIPGDANFEKLYDAIGRRDFDAAFEAAHALKGPTGNLALTPLYTPVSEITELLRARTDTDYSALVAAIRDAHARLSALCAE